MGKEYDYVKKKVGKVAEEGKGKELLHDQWINVRGKYRDAGCEAFCGKLQSVAEES